MTKNVLLIEAQKTPVQSGKCKQGFWFIRFVDKNYKKRDQLVGWISADATDFQVKLSLNTKEEALRYIKESGLNLLSIFDAPKIIKAHRTYADNFL